METFYVERYEKTRFFAVRAAAGTLVCVCVYKRGAEEVAQRLQALDDGQRWVDANGPAQEVGPGVAQGSFFGQVSSKLFVYRCDETK